MRAVEQVFQYLIDLGMIVTIPLIILFLGLLVGVKIGRAARAALITGIGFAGIFLVVDLLVGTLSAVTKAIVDNIGLKLTVVDIGWPAAATVALTNAQIVPWVYLLGIALNIVLLTVNFTKTLDVDMWNYWHFMFAANVAAVVTGQPWLGVLTALVMLAVFLILADWTAPVVQDFFGLPGISFPHGNTVAWAPLGLLINKIIDAIPVVRTWDATPKAIRQRFGLIGEPMFLGALIGFILSVLAYYPRLGVDLGAAAKDILRTTVNLSAVIFIMPRMVAILMEGLYPFSEGVREFMSRRFAAREVYIGIDAAAAIGQESVIATGMALTPIILALAILMNAVGLNRMLPYADLAALPFFSIWAVGWCRGNMVRSLISGTIFSVFILFIATDLAPIATQIAQRIKPDIIPAGLQISTVSIGAEFVGWLLTLPFRLFGTAGGIVGLILVALAFIIPLKGAIEARKTPAAAVPAKAA